MSTWKMVVIWSTVMMSHEANETGREIWREEKKYRTHNQCLSKQKSATHINKIVYIIKYLNQYSICMRHKQSCLFNGICLIFDHYDLILFLFLLFSTFVFGRLWFFCRRFILVLTNISLHLIKKYAHIFLQTQTLWSPKKRAIDCKPIDQAILKISYKYI